MREIWCQCIEHNVCLKFSRIPGKDSLIEDYEYGKSSGETEWALNQAISSLDNIITFIIFPDIEAYLPHL